MGEGKSQWFYDVVDKLVSGTSSSLRKYDPDIEKFIRYIEYGQYPDKYTKHLGVFAVSQSDVDKILRIPCVDVRYRLFTSQELYHFFQTHYYQNELIVLTCADKRVLHTIGVFVSGLKYYLWDANMPSGRPIEFSKPWPLIDEIKKRFYQAFYLPIPRDSMLLALYVLKTFTLKRAEQKEPQALSKNM